MATKPTYYPEWATEDTNLPATGQTNKLRPKESLRLIGWDKGQLITAEEFNWILNNLYLWTQFYDESIAENLNAFLPKQGTTINFTGKATGTVSFNGQISATVGLDIADLNNATSAGTANTLVKRDAEGGTSFTRGIHVRSPAPGSSNNADYWLEDNTGTTKGSFAWLQNTDQVWIYKGNGIDAPDSELRLSTGYVGITSPRSTTAQGTVGESLTRKDYVDSQITTVNNSISALNTTLTNAINTTNGNVTNLTNYVNNTFVKQVRLGTQVRVGNSDDVQAIPGSVFTMIGDFGADDGYGGCSPLQYLVNNTWITAVQL